MTAGQDERGRARLAADAERWAEAYERFDRLDPDGLSPADWQRFADAAFWCCRTGDEVRLRQRAFAGFAAAGEPLAAAYAAWLLSVRLRLQGQHVTASGWLQRAERQLIGQAESPIHGFVACGEAERAVIEGRPHDGLEHAALAVEVGQRFDEPRLVALALAWQGLCLLGLGDADGSGRCLDEAMVSVTSGELDDFFTGWIYCFTIGICIGTADLRRASTWSRQAWAWASSRAERTPYLGVCRIHQVELMSLRGELVDAESEAHLACQEVLEFEPNLAGEAFYVAGDVLRRRGDLVGAEAAFDRARSLGHDPQPGLALVRLAQGRPDEAASALRAADAGGPPLRQSALLSARVEVAVERGRLDDAAESCRALAELAESTNSEAVQAMAATCRGRVLLARAEAEAALRELRPAATSWQALDLACEAARTRTLLGIAMRELGDEDGALQELHSAKHALERLGARPDAKRVVALLGERSSHATPLTGREVEVLTHVASGSTNREIARALDVSEHTVARHLSNIFTKIDVSSRTAAAAYAFENDLV
jgi:ATP/maltotriose-dependent transcriptional regulator MalT